MNWNYTMKYECRPYTPLSNPFFVLIRVHISPKEHYLDQNRNGLDRFQGSLAVLV